MSPTGVRVRPGNEGDAAAIGELIEGVYLGEGWSTESARARLSDGCWVMAQGEVLVAEAGGTIVGSVVLVAPGAAGRQVGHEDEVEVRLLAVSPVARGAGAGEALMRELLHRAEDMGFAAVVLSTQPGMEAAQRLYQRLGFVRQPGRDWRRGSGVQMLVFRKATR